MYGVVEIGTRKVYAKSKKKTALSDLDIIMRRMKTAYPDRKFRIEEVKETVRCVGEIDSKVVFIPNKGSI